ncbi:hypothetical protein NQ317_001669 [Molorchus minor]|uniref:Uncharacterized protein n=1 Tax=Molorchus minor TaxID=1323400 RepID=A0ABQ9IRX2_9CUCU|nr:hypothetical protein NQ317_001669 [Molorchus minor]
MKNGFVLIHAEPSICYFCRTAIEGEACDDPVDTSAILRQQCSDFTLVDTLSNVLGIAKPRLAVALNDTDVDDEVEQETISVVCATISF